MYTKILEAYRDNPTVSYSQCGRDLGYGRRTVEKAHKAGWPSWNLRPIRQLLEEEAAAARVKTMEAERQMVLSNQAKLVAASVELQEKARQDSINTASEEAILARASRRIVMGLQNALQKSLPLMMKMMDALPGEAELQALPLRERLAILRLVADLHSTLTAGGAAALQVERLRLGKPTVTVGVEYKATNVTLEDAERKVAALHTAVERARSRGIVILDGGPPAPKQLNGNGAGHGGGTPTGGVGPS